MKNHVLTTILISKLSNLEKMLQSKFTSSNEEEAEEDILFYRIFSEIYNVLSLIRQKLEELDNELKTTH